jgi:glycosyltransferase involved in cell wall biosynthesis
LFALPTGHPPPSWKVRTYLTAPSLPEHLDPEIRRCLHPTPEEMQEALRQEALSQEVMMRQRGKPIYCIPRLLRKILHLMETHFEKLQPRRVREGPIGSAEPDQETLSLQPRAPSAEMWLAQIIQDWHPDIIHTLGLEPASFFYLSVRNSLEDANSYKWIAQARGGPDLALHRLLPNYSDRISHVLKACDQFIADNQQNYGYALEMGLERQKITPLGVIPGTGGVDVDSLTQGTIVPPSQRQRIVLWPKAYECPQSKAVPVFEAIRLSWETIQPCVFYMSAVVQEEIHMWHRTLPAEIREHCQLLERIPRDELLRLMTRSRVLLAPSLSDGVPNTLYEAMAVGTFPIVSPLETIGALVENKRNVLFARNLYPEEMAMALRTAMNDDALVDSAAERNLDLVRQLADRKYIGPKVIEYYEHLAGL